MALNDGNNMETRMQQSMAANYLYLFNYLIATASPIILTPSPPPIEQPLLLATTAADNPTNFIDVDNNIHDEIGSGGTVGIAA